MKNYLKEQGYKISEDSCAVRLRNDCDWVAFSKIETDNLCICNDKPPQIVISHTCGEYFGHHFDNYSIEVVNENNLGWLKLEYYNLSEEDLRFNLKKYEQALTLAGIAFLL